MEPITIDDDIDVDDKFSSTKPDLIEEIVESIIKNSKNKGKGEIKSVYNEKNKSKEKQNKDVVALYNKLYKKLNKEIKIKNINDLSENIYKIKKFIDKYNIKNDPDFFGLNLFFKGNTDLPVYEFVRKKLGFDQKIRKSAFNALKNNFDIDFYTQKKDQIKNEAKKNEYDKLIKNKKKIVYQFIIDDEKLAKFKDVNKNNLKDINKIVTNIKKYLMKLKEINNELLYYYNKYIEADDVNINNYNNSKDIFIKRINKFKLQDVYKKDLYENIMSDEDYNFNGTLYTKEATKLINLMVQLDVIDTNNLKKFVNRIVLGKDLNASKSLLSSKKDASAIDKTVKDLKNLENLRFGIHKLTKDILINYRYRNIDIFGRLKLLESKRNKTKQFSQVFSDFKKEIDYFNKSIDNIVKDKNISVKPKTKTYEVTFDILNRRARGFEKSLKQYNKQLNSSDDTFLNKEPFKNMRKNIGKNLNELKFLRDKIKNLGVFAFDFLKYEDKAKLGIRYKVLMKRYNDLITSFENLDNVLKGQSKEQYIKLLNKYNENIKNTKEFLNNIKKKRKLITEHDNIYKKNFEEIKKSEHFKFSKIYDLEIVRKKRFIDFTVLEKLNRIMSEEMTDQSNTEKISNANKLKKEIEEEIKSLEKKNDNINETIKFNKKIKQSITYDSNLKKTNEAVIAEYKTNITKINDFIKDLKTRLEQKEINNKRIQLQNELNDSIKKLKDFFKIHNVKIKDIEHNIENIKIGNKQLISNNLIGTSYIRDYQKHHDKVIKEFEKGLIDRKKQLEGFDKDIKNIQEKLKNTEEEKKNIEKKVKQLSEQTKSNEQILKSEFESKLKILTSEKEKKILEIEQKLKIETKELTNKQKKKLENLKTKLKEESDKKLNKLKKTNQEEIDVKVKQIEKLEEMINEKKEELDKLLGDKNPKIKKLNDKIKTLNTIINKAELEKEKKQNELIKLKTVNVKQTTNINELNLKIQELNKENKKLEGYEFKKDLDKVQNNMDKHIDSIILKDTIDLNNWEKIKSKAKIFENFNKVFIKKVNVRLHRLENAYSKTFKRILSKDIFSDLPGIFKSWKRETMELWGTKDGKDIILKMHIKYTIPVIASILSSYTIVSFFKFVIKTFFKNSKSAIKFNKKNVILKKETDNMKTKLDKNMMKRKSSEFGKRFKPLKKQKINLNEIHQQIL